MFVSTKNSKVLYHQSLSAAGNHVCHNNGS